MKVVFDECISIHLVRALQNFRAPGDVAHTRDLSYDGLTDREWMLDAIAKDYAIITGDRNAKTRKVTSAEFVCLNAVILFLGPFWDQLKIWDKSKWLIANWERVHEAISSSEPGTCLLAHSSGRIVEA